MEQALWHIQMAITHGCTKYEGFLIYLEYIKYFYYKLHSRDINYLKYQVEWVLKYTQGQLTK